MTTPARASDELAARYLEIAAVRAAAGPCRLPRPRRSAFEALAAAIVYQQLAGRAAAAIHGRLLALAAQVEAGEAGGRALTPGAVLALGPDRLRTAGLSGAKTASLLDLSQRVADGRLSLHGLGRLPDDDVVARLLPVRGIGRWTAEMFLIFHLRRLDVWPVGDYGVRKGYALLHGLDDLPSPRELADLGERYRPWRTVAAWYCWRAVEGATPAVGP